MVSSAIESYHFIFMVKPEEWQDPVMFRRSYANNSLEGMLPDFDIFIIKLKITKCFPYIQNISL